MEDRTVLSEETPRAALEDRDLLRRLLAEVSVIRIENQQLKSQVTNLTTKTMLLLENAVTSYNPRWRCAGNFKVIYSVYYRCFIVMLLLCFPFP